MIIDGVEYVEKSKAVELAPLTDGLKYVVCRTYSAGVHIGYLKSKEGQTVELVNSRRLWQWSGAAELCQVAMDGVDDDSKFSTMVPEIIIDQVIEVITVSNKAKEILEGLD